MQFSRKNIGSSIALWAILGVVFWRFSHCIIPVSIEYNCMFRFRHDSMQPCQVFWIISQIFHFRFQLGLRALTVSCYSFFIFIAFMVPPHCYPRVNKGNIPCVQKKKRKRRRTGTIISVRPSDNTCLTSAFHPLSFRQCCVKRNEMPHGIMLWEIETVPFFLEPGLCPWWDVQ